MSSSTLLRIITSTTIQPQHTIYFAGAPTSCNPPSLASPISLYLSFPTSLYNYSDHIGCRPFEAQCVRWYCDNLFVKTINLRVALCSTLLQVGRTPIICSIKQHCLARSSCALFANIIKLLTAHTYHLHASFLQLCYNFVPRA
jgi:hypothetical protein